MDPPKSHDQKWKCPHCQGTERLHVHFSTKHLRNIRNKILAKIIDMGEYLPIFEMVKSMYRDAISKSMEGITQCFREYESLAEKDLLSKRECYFMVHYDASKKWKKRSCYIPDNVLSQVEIADPRYFSLYRPMIEQLTKLYNIKAPYEERFHLFTTISNILKMLGWPRRYLNDKIIADSLVS
jgi:hypothetical protein